MVANNASRCRTCLATAFLIVAFPPLLMAQAVGELTGKVTDPAGTPVAFALVTTTSVETGRALPAATGTDGTYSVRLPSGSYRIKFESLGYKGSEIIAANVSGASTVVENCELEALAQTQSNPTSPAQKSSARTNNPTEPSLGDLGISLAQAKGNAGLQALLDRRSHMLKTHQRLGLITLGPFGATLITSAFAGGRQTSSTGRDLHAGLGAATVGLYFATAYFAIRAPKVPGTATRGPIRLHKTLAWIHGPGMILTPILGGMALAQKDRGEKVHGIASLHGPVAIATAGAFGLAVASVSFKF